MAGPARRGRLRGPADSGLVIERALDTGRGRGGDGTGGGGGQGLGVWRSRALSFDSAITVNY